MKLPRTKAWMKAKYFLLVKENISEHENKSAEVIITILHKQYCSKMFFKNKENKSEQETYSFDS